jgi:hypothetical protein
MQTVNIFKLLPKLKLRPNNFKRCLTPELQLSKKNLLEKPRNWPKLQLIQDQLNKKRTMVI